MMVIYVPRRVSGSDAVLWKREEIGEFNHKMLWFEGKKWDENRPVFARFFYSFEEAWDRYSKLKW